MQQFVCQPVLAAIAETNLAVTTANTDASPPKPDRTMIKHRGVSVHPTAPNPWGHRETNLRNNPRAGVVGRDGLPACRAMLPNAWRLT